MSGRRARSGRWRGAGGVEGGRGSGGGRLGVEFGSHPGKLSHPLNHHLPPQVASNIMNIILAACFLISCFTCVQILPLVEAFESIKFDLVRKLSELINTSSLFKTQLSASF